MTLKFFDELGLNFPLFHGPVSQAVIDGPDDCERCGTEVPIRFANTCYDCFRAGKAHHTIDTELGMVRAEDAEMGLTHGVPLTNPNELAGYELVPHPVDPNFPDEHWYSVRVAKEYLRELVRTPVYQTVQGECWQFCCQKPCTFLGSVSVDVVEQRAVAAGCSEEALIEQAFGSSIRDARISLMESEAGSAFTYVFRCQDCGTLRSHSDAD